MTFQPRRQIPAIRCSLLEANYSSAKKENKRNLLVVSNHKRRVGKKKDKSSD